MGFGMLFAGYATLLMFRSIPIELIGFFVIYLALDKLQTSCASFKYAKYASAYLFFEAVLSSCIWICNFAGVFVPLFENKSFLSVETALYHIGLVAFHIALYRGLFDISKITGYEKGKKRTRFCFVTTCVFYVGEIVASVLPSTAPYISLPLAIFQIFWICANIFLIFGCYMMIVTDKSLEKEERKYNEYLAKHQKLKIKHSSATKKPSNDARKKFKVGK